MQTELLRDLLNEALKEPNEDTRTGCFWVYAPDYDIEIGILFKKIYKLSLDGCTVTRKNNDFLIEDSHGGTDIYTECEMGFLIDLWEKATLRDQHAHFIDLGVWEDIENQTNEKNIDS
jgi:hypothetical protein